MMEEVSHLSLPRVGHIPVVEEGTNDFGSDWVELQVRDIVEVLLAVFQEAQERKSQDSGHQWHGTQAAWCHFVPNSPTLSPQASCLQIG